MSSLERISSFIQSYITDEKGQLAGIYDDAVQRGVPVIRKETKELLKTQLLALRPRKILEIGTAVGYSALVMLDCLKDENVAITTLEIDEDRIREALHNIRQAQKEKQIKVIQGDAMETLKTLEDSVYDFVFVDAAKAQYINYYPEIMRVVKKGGMIISDNLLQEGEILESHFSVDKRNRTIHDRMREYIYTITHDERLVTSVLSVGDGVAISIVEDK